MTKTGREREAVLRRVQLAVTRTRADESLRVIRQRRLTIGLLLTLAGELRVDLRWLWTGRISPAGQAAIDLLEDHWLHEPTETDSATEAICLLELTPQPVATAGVCRYCGCTEDYACDVGCAWVDPGATICSACLIEAG